MIVSFTDDVESDNCCFYFMIYIYDWVLLGTPIGEEIQNRRGIKEKIK